MIVETPLHHEKVTVLCAFWSDGISGPYFFVNAPRWLNSERMLSDYFWREIEDYNLKDMCLKQDGATPHWPIEFFC